MPVYEYKCNACGKEFEYQHAWPIRTRLIARRAESRRSSD